MWRPLVFAVVGFWGLLLLLKLSFPYLAPFFLGLLLAALLDGPVSYLESLGWSRSITSFVLTLTTFLGLPLVFLVFLLQLWQETKGLVRLVPWGNWPQLFSDQVVQFLESLPWFATQLAPANLAGLVDTLWRWALAIPDLFVVWVLACFSAYFFCKDKRLFTTFITKRLSRKWRLGFFQVYRDISRACWDLLRVQLILMLISTTLSMVFFCLLQLPYALLLGFVVGLVDLVPVVGPGLIYLTLAVAQIYLGNLSVALALGVAYLILLLIRQFGEPHLVSDRLGLHPLVAVLSLYVGFRFWGLLGAMVGPILMVFLKVFIATYATF